MTPKIQNALSGSKRKPMEQIKNNKYLKKSLKYRRRIKDLQAKLDVLKQEQAAHERLKCDVQQLQEKIKQDEVLYNRYYDALDAHGLICGICFEEVVQQDSLACCSNKLCAGCERQITEKHNQCPFCREVLKPELLQQQQEQTAGLQAPGDMHGPAAHAWAAIHAFLAARREQATTADDSDYSDMDSDAEYSDDCSEGAAEDSAAPDTTMLMAAAAEAMYAAQREPEGACGLCTASYRMSALATTEQLPDMLLCRSCWRNIPDLAAQPFPAGRLHSTSSRAAAADAAITAGQSDADVSVTAAAFGPAAPEALKHGHAQGHKPRSSIAVGVKTAPKARSPGSAPAAAAERISKKKRKQEKINGSDAGGRNKHAPILKRKRSSCSTERKAGEVAAHGSGNAASSKTASKKSNSKRRHQRQALEVRVK